MSGNSGQAPLALATAIIKYGGRTKVIEYWLGRREEDMKAWEIAYKGHTIRVENRAFGERLLVDGELQDCQIGLGSRSRLYGVIGDGDGAGEQIKVSFGSTFTVQCRIFVDHKLVGS